MLNLMERAGLVVPTSVSGRVRLAADDKVALGPEASPTPLRATECGLPTVLSVIVVEALLGPNWPGVTLTLMTQFAPAARLDPQLLFSLKSAALVPASATPLMRTGMLPVLVTVSGCTAEGVPTNCGAKLKLGAERVRVSGSKRIDTV